MLGSLLRSTFRQTFRAPLLFNIPKQPFATAAPQKSNTQSQQTAQTNVSENKSDAFVDPRLEELSNYVFGIKLERVQKIYKNCDFEKDMIPALNIYKEYGFNDIQLRFVMKRKPSLLRLYPNEPINDVQKYSTWIMEKFNLSAKDFRTSFLRNPWIVNLSKEELEAKFTYLQTTMGMTNKEIRRLLIVYPTTFNSHVEEWNEKLRILRDFLDMSPRTAGIISARFPYFLRNRTKYLKDNIILLLQKGFSKEQITAIMKRHAEPFTIKPTNLQHSFFLPRKSRMSREEVAKTITENPRLLSIDGTTMQPRKINIMKRYGIPKGAIYRMFKLYPRIFIKSYGSTHLKLKYLIERMELRLVDEKAFPAILNFSYANIIRPRGELMIAKGKILPWTEVLRMKDEEFVEKVGATLEEINTLKKDFQTRNNELDHKFRFFTRFVSNSGVNAKY